jgi:hypothetical protein
MYIHSRQAQAPVPPPMYDSPGIKRPARQKQMAGKWGTVPRPRNVVRPSFNATKQQFRNEPDLRLCGGSYNISSSPPETLPHFHFRVQPLHFPSLQNRTPSIQRVIPEAKYKLPGLKTPGPRKRVGSRLRAAHFPGVVRKFFARIFTTKRAHNLADIKILFCVSPPFDLLGRLPCATRTIAVRPGRDVTLPRVPFPRGQGRETNAD